jgi:cytochrome b6-f complex iron-sulfur subunit
MTEGTGTPAPDAPAQRPQAGPQRGRRWFVSSLIMLGGLAASYGTAILMAARYIYPRKGIRRVRRVFLAPIADVPEGASRSYSLPGGAVALVTNTGADVVALSNTCPHLGCKIHWETSAKEFRCPCHGGVFTPDGTATAGPPAQEGKNLKRYPVTRVEQNLFIDVEEVIQL